MNREKIEGELLDYLGFTRKEDGTYPAGNYDDVCKSYGVDVVNGELENEHEEKLGEDHGPVFLAENFPERTYTFLEYEASGSGPFQIRLMLLCMVLKLLV